MSFLSRFQIDIQHFTQSEIAAQGKAVAITTEIKNILSSGGAVTIEALTGTTELGAATVAVLNEFIAALNSPAVQGVIATVNSLLGGLGAQLTAAIHEGAPVLTGIEHWIMVFESLFHLNKQAAATA